MDSHTRKPHFRWPTRFVRWWAIPVFVLAAAVPLAGAVFVYATVSTVLEVDGNVIDGAAAGEDWAAVIGTSCSNTSDDGGTALVQNCVVDPLSGDSGFTLGSKDTLDISAWGWASAPGEQSPPKDNIKNAYGALYSDGGSRIVYFGLDRAVTSGNANVAFWFFQTPVSLAAGGAFSGVHAIGDILVVAAFTNGGNITNLNVYRWNPAVKDNLELISSSTPGANVGCNSEGTVCVGVNAAPLALTWRPDSPVDTAAFFEGGVNLDALGFGATSCLSNFIGETRSSQETTATLHDFALGSFNTCGGANNPTQTIVPLSSVAPTVTPVPTFAPTETPVPTSAPTETPFPPAAVSTSTPESPSPTTTVPESASSTITPTELVPQPTLLVSVSADLTTTPISPVPRFLPRTGDGTPDLLPVIAVALAMLALGAFIKMTARSHDDRPVA